VAQNVSPALYAVQVTFLSGVLLNVQVTLFAVDDEDDVTWRTQIPFLQIEPVKHLFPTRPQLLGSFRRLGVEDFGSGRGPYVPALDDAAAPQNTYISAKCWPIGLSQLAASFRLQLGHTWQVFFMFAHASPCCGAPLQ
jgi:hypothetical protein